MKNILIIDTNVLLRDPNALFAYPKSEIVIPQVVLSELDKIKVVRNNKDIRFRGREVSRILFELSEYGLLTDGIELDNEAVIRVAQYEPEDFPESLNRKNADDRILGCAIREQQHHPEARIVLVTNDLNMLLKAQTLDIEVQRHEDEFQPSLTDRLFGWLRQKRLSLLWAAVPIVLLGIITVLWLFVPSPIPTGDSPVSVFGLTSFPLREVEYLNTLKDDPNNFRARYQLGELYSDWGEKLQADGQSRDARGKIASAVESYEQALTIRPNSSAVRTSLGTAHLFLGNSNEAISQFIQAISFDSNYAPAHFNLGFALLNRNQDLSGAARHFEAYLQLEPNGERSDYARQKLKELESQ